MNIGEMFVRLGLDISDFSKGVEQVQGELARLESAFTTVGATLTAAISVPLTAMAGMGLKAFAGFEDELLKVSAYAQTTGREFELLRAQALKLGQDTQFSAKEAAEAMAQYAVQGFKVTEIYRAMPGVLDLAAAGQLKVSDAAKISAAVLKGFNLTASDTARVADVLAKTATSSATTVQTLGGSFLYAGSIASTLGVKFEQLATAFAVLGDSGSKGWKAGTAMRAFFLDLTSGAAKTEAALKSLGITIWESPGKFKDLGKLLKEMYDAGITSAEKLTQAQAIWGARTAEALTLVKSINGKFQETEQKINNATGAAQKMREVLQSGLSGTWERLTSSIETLGIAIGSILAPAAKSVIEYFKDAIDAVTVFVEKLAAAPAPVRNAVVAFTALGVAVGPVLVTLGLLTGAVANLKELPIIVGMVGSSFQTLGGKLAGVSTSVGQFMGMFSPSSIKAGFGSLVDTVKEFGNAMVQGVKDLPAKMSLIKTTVVDGFSAIGPAISSAGSTIAGYARTAVGLITTQFAAMSEAIAAKGFIGAISALASSVGTGLVGALGSAASAIGTFVASAAAAAAPIALIVAAVAALAAAAYAVYKNWDEIKAVLVGIWKDLQVAFAAFGKWFIESIDKVFGSEVAGVVKKVWDGIVKFFGSAWEAIKNVAANAFKYLLEGAQAAANAIGASNTAAAIQSWIVKLDGMGDASKKMAASVAASMRDQADAAMGASGANVKLADSIKTAGGAAELSKKQLKELADAKKLARDNAIELSAQMLKLDQILRAAPDSAQEFINKFSKIHEIPPEIQKAGAYIEDLQKKFEKLGEDAKAAFAKGNAELGAGYKGLQVNMQMLIDEQKRYLEVMKAWSGVAADVESVVKELDLLRVAHNAVNMEALKLPPIFKEIQDNKLAEMMQAPINGVTNLVSAFKALNIQSSTTLRKSADDAAYYYGVIQKAYGEHKASIMDLKQAQLALLDAQMKAGAAEGQNISALKAKYGELRAELEASGIAVKGHTKAVRDYWQELDKQVSTIFTDMGKGIADAMFSAKSLGDFFAKTFTEMGKAIVRFTVEYWTKIWLTELYKGIKGMTDFGVAASKSLSILTGVNAGGVVDAAGNPLPGTGGAGATLPGTTLPGKDSLGGLTKAAGGLLGAVGAIASAIDAVFGALQYFQGRRIEQDVGRMEVTTRGILNVLLQIQETVNQHLPALQDLRFLQNFNLQMVQVADIITINFEKLIDALKEGIKVSGNVTTAPDEPGGGSGSSSGGSTIDPVTGLPKASDDPNVLKKQIKELQDLLIKQAQSAANAAAVNAGIVKDVYDSTTTATNNLSNVVSNGSSTIANTVSNLGPQIADLLDASTVITADAIAKSGSYYQASMDALRAGILLNVATLDKTRLTQEQLIELSRVGNEMLGTNTTAIDANGNIVKTYFKSFTASADGNTSAVADNTVATGINNDGIGALGDSIYSNSQVTDASTRAGIMTSAMLTTSQDQLSKTLEIASKTYANVAHVTAPDFTSAYTSKSETEAYIASLAKMLGADKGAQPIYSDPMWQKYLDLIGSYASGGAGKGGIGNGNTGVTTSSQPLFNNWPTYDQLFGQQMSQISNNMNTAANAASQFAAANSTLSGAGYTTKGSSNLANNPANIVNLTNNFNGVTDPAKMATKIVQSLSLQGVTF